MLQSLVSPHREPSYLQPIQSDRNFHLIAPLYGNVAPAMCLQCAPAGQHHVGLARVAPAPPLRRPATRWSCVSRTHYRDDNSSVGRHASHLCIRATLAPPYSGAEAETKPPRRERCVLRRHTTSRRLCDSPPGGAGRGEVSRRIALRGGTPTKASERAGEERLVTVLPTTARGVSREGRRCKVF